MSTSPTIGKVLVACEFSGIVREAFSKRGWHAVSCDFLPTIVPGNHYVGNVMDIIDDGWDLMIAHPPCNYLATSGIHWTTRGFRDPKLTEDALAFVEKLMSANIHRIALENPVSIISSKIRKPDQTIQPWNFGHDASKATCLWLKNLPLLIPTKVVPPRIVDGKKRWGNQSDAGQSKTKQSLFRKIIRSVTFEGIADAMADQWTKAYLDSLL